MKEEEIEERERERLRRRIQELIRTSWLSASWILHLMLPLCLDGNDAKIPVQSSGYMSTITNFITITTNIDSPF